MNTIYSHASLFWIMPMRSSFKLSIPQTPLRHVQRFSTLTEITLTFSKTCTIDSPCDPRPSLPITKIKNSGVHHLAETLHSQGCKR